MAARYPANAISAVLAQGAIFFDEAASVEWLSGAAPALATLDDPARDGEPEPLPPFGLEMAELGSLPGCSPTSRP